MENASRALLMAGGILIALLILTAGVVLYNSLNNNSKEHSNNQATIQAQHRNAKFEQFRGRDDITIQEIVTIYDYIQEYKNKVPYTITLKVDGFVWGNLTISNKFDKFKTATENAEKYKCTEIEYSNGEIILISFQKTL